MESMFGRSQITRYQREMMGVVVSAANKCKYCVEHHRVALDHFWKDSNKSAQLLTDYNTVDLSDSDKALCRYAQDLTINPESIAESDHIRILKESGSDERAILDAALVISYFNFVNRLILGLGISVDKDVAGYNYD